MNIIIIFLKNEILFLAHSNAKYVSTNLNDMDFILTLNLKSVCVCLAHYILGQNAETYKYSNFLIKTV